MTRTRNTVKRTSLGLAVAFLALVNAAACSRSSDSPPGPGAGNPVPSRPQADSAAVPAAKKTCADCHAEQHKFRDYGGHAEIACKECHEVEGNHEEADEKPVLGGNAQCLGCHDLVEGAGSENLSEADIFERHMKFLEKKHVIEVDRKQGSRRCVECHDPHLGQ